MPSETRSAGAAAGAETRPAPTLPRLPAPLLARPRERFSSALALLLEQVRGLLAEHDAVADPAGGEEASALGGFADGRIDPARFAALFAGTPAVDDATASGLRGVFEVLSGLSGRLESLVGPRIELGETLRDCVDRALAEVGRAFAAARAVARLRSGSAQAAGGRGPAEAARPGLAPIGAFPFRLWSRAERDLAPPLVIELDGADLAADALAEFLDGAVKLVLVVRGPAPPAPLVRLVTPGVFVAQADDPAQLAGLADWPGPAVVALLPPGGATFVHAPARGAALAERLSIGSLPADPQLAPLDGRSVRQQADELAQLRALAEAAAARPSAMPAPPSVDGAVPAAAAATPLAAADPAEALAAWLVDQADLADL